MGWLSLIGNRLAALLLGGAALIAGALLALSRARQQGRDVERAEAREQTITAAKVRRDVEDDIRRSGGDSAVDRLRNDWSRD